ncbi:MAG: hypothetical protein AAFX05_07110 [Planctomycetota bacterium]
MTSRARIMALALFGLLVCAGGWWTYRSKFASPIADARAAISDRQLEIAKLQRDTSTLSRAARELRAVADSSLGKDAESALHQLRLAMSDVAERAGLRVESVDSRIAEAPRNPATDSRGAREINDKATRESIDFVVVAGTLEASGTYEQCARAIGLMQAQSWPCRSHAVTLAPDGPNVVRMRLGIETIYFPDLPSDGPPELVGDDGNVSARIARIANVFAPPPQPVVAAEPTPKARAKPKPKPAARPEEDRWRVTGFARGGGGAELWLVADGGDRRVLQSGEKLGDCTFESLVEGGAVILWKEQRFLVRPGDRLSRRDTPASAR